jgi:hypothetical protein
MLNGDRVGAVKSFDHGTLKVFGFGEYVGEEVPPEEGIGYSKFLYEGQQKDHKILLDDGHVIYGSECWLFDELEVRKSMKEYDHVEYVDIDELRKG